MLTLFFISLSIAFRSHHLLAGFSYTVSIIGAVCIALYHPEYFTGIGDFKFSSLTIPLLQVIMFGMGTELSWKDFAQVSRTTEDRHRRPALSFSQLCLFSVGVLPICFASFGDRCRYHTHQLCSQRTCLERDGLFIKSKPGIICLYHSNNHVNGTHSYTAADESTGWSLYRNRFLENGLGHI